MNKIADAIRKNDMALYQRERYPAIQEGESLVFEDEDFSATSFGQFSAGFFEFRNCNLDGVEQLYGQPIIIEGGTARGIDFRGARAIIEAAGCDFTGMKYDENTQLSYGKEGTDAHSEFVNYVLDESTKEYFSRQGVIFK